MDTSMEVPESSKMDDMKHRLTGATSQVRDKATEFGRSAKETIDRNFHNAAGAFETAASTIRKRMPQGEGRMAGMATATADKLDSTARYMREHNSGDLYRGVEDWARRSPGTAIGVAAGVGLLLGLALKRDRKYRY
jgi:ElaB/YqjD/DUF883 family membrane-anchored ribosome-binding protein